jgi:hypothetical protein
MAAKIGTSNVLFRVGSGSPSKVFLGSVAILNVPGAPTAVSGTAGDEQVSLTWSAPSSNGGASITDYTVQYSSNGGSTWTTFSRSASTNTNATVTSLTNGTGYVFRVAAVNAIGTGAYSASSSSVTPASPGPATLYFDGDADDDWTNVANWWLDASHTQAAGRLPTSDESVVASAGIMASGQTVVDFTMSAGSLFGNLTVTGMATFNDSSTNSGTVTGDATFNDSSSNSGTVSGNATFNDSSRNSGGSGTVNGDATFNGSSSNFGGGINGDATFNDSSFNFGTVTGNATFNGSSVNNAGTVTGDATFNDSSSNFGTVNGTVTCNTTGECTPT